MALLLLKVCAVVYFVGAVVGFIQMFAHRWAYERIGAVGLALGAVSHVVALVVRAVDLGSFPMANTHDGISLFAFTAAVCGSVIAFRGRVPQVGPVVSLLVWVMVLVSVMIEPADEVPVNLRSAWLPIHIGLAFLADAAFAVAGIVSVVYVIQERRLKQKKTRWSGTARHGLPALEILDRLNFRLIEAGFPLMTLALISGAIYGKEVWGTYWTWEPRTTVSLLVWVLFALLLHFRITIGWRGRKAAMLTVVGAVATLLSMLVLGLLGIGSHGQDYTS